jgi:hypothetical protein
MNFSIGYLAYQFVYRIRTFIYNWYFGGLLFGLHHTMNIILRLDRTFAWRITLRHMFEPLYQDHSLLGHILGFIFRILRLSFGGILYGVVIVFVVALYFLWASIPIFLLYSTIFKSYL